MKDRTYKAIVVGYTNNHTGYIYKLYNTEAKRVITKRDIKWAERKMIDPAGTMNILCDLNGYD